MQPQMSFLSSTRLDDSDDGPGLFSGAGCSPLDDAVGPSFLPSILSLQKREMIGSTNLWK